MWNSRKFRAMVYDVVLSLVLYFVVKYVEPSVVADIKFVIGALQPVVLAFILGTAAEDYALKANKESNLNRAG